MHPAYLPSAVFRCQHERTKGRQGASTISHRPAVLIPFMAAATSLNRCAPYHFHRIQITSCRLHETKFSHTNHL